MKQQWLNWVTKHKVLAEQQSIDFKNWIGYAKKVPQNPYPKFRADDDLWQKDK